MNQIRTRLPFLVAISLACASAAPAQRLTLEYARDYDFGSVATYRLARELHDDPEAQLIHDRLRYAVIRELHRGGALSVSRDPDLDVRFRITDGGPVDDIEAPPGPGWTHWKGSAAKTDPPPPQTLVITAIDVHSGEMVWRGTGSVRVKPTATVDKRLKKIDAVISKLGSRWRKILAGKAS